MKDKYDKKQTIKVDCVLCSPMSSAVLGCGLLCAWQSLHPSIRIWMYAETKASVGAGEKKNGGCMDCVYR